MRGHKKTKESGFFEGDSTETEIMTKALKRTKVFTTSGDGKRIVEYTQDDSESQIQNADRKGKPNNLNNFSFNVSIDFSCGVINIYYFTATVY